MLTLLTADVQRVDVLALLTCCCWRVNIVAVLTTDMSTLSMCWHCWNLMAWYCWHVDIIDLLKADMYEVWHNHWKFLSDGKLILQFNVLAWWICCCIVGFKEDMNSLNSLILHSYFQQMSLLFYHDVCLWWLEFNFFLVSVILSNVIRLSNFDKISNFLLWCSIIKIILQLDNLFDST